MKSFVFTFLFIGLSFISAYSQCNTAYVTAVNQPSGQVDFTIMGYTPPAGWDVSCDVGFGDFTTGSFTGNTVSHVYSENINYGAGFYIHYYQILDTSINCDIYATVSFSVSNGSGYTETCNLDYNAYQHCTDSILFDLAAMPTLNPGYGYNYYSGSILLSTGTTFSNPCGFPLSYVPWPDSAGFIYELYYLGNLVCVDTSWSPVPATISPFGLDVMVDYNTISEVELNDTSSTNMFFKTCNWGDGIVQNNIYNYYAIHDYIIDGDYTVIANSFPSYQESTWLPYHPSCLTYDTVVVSINGLSNSLSCNLNPIVDFNYATYTLNFGLYSGSTRVSSPNLNVSWSFNNGMNSTQDFGTFTSVVTPPTSFTVSYDIMAYGGSIVCSNTTTMSVNALIPSCNALVDIYEDTVTTGLYWAVDQSTGGISPYTYFWDFGDGSTSTLQFPTHTYAVPTYYTVCLTITDSQTPPCVSTICNDSIGFIMVGDVATRSSSPMIQLNAYNPGAIGLEENSMNDFSLFPNPADAFIIVTPPENYSGEIQISICDLNGRIIESVKYNETSLINLPVNHLSSGIYFLKIDDDTKSTIKKFIKK